MPTKRHNARAGPVAQQKVIALARRRGVLRPRDLDAERLPRETLRRLHQAGKLARRGRGLYVLADAASSEQALLAAASVRVPHAIVCLLSALRYHRLTTQNPPDIWLAIDRKARAPMERDLPLRIVRFSGAARTEGVERHLVDGVQLRVYGVAKTIADCFKYRRKIGVDVAIEALRDCWRARKCSMDELWRYAAICRVTNVMRSYLEAITASTD